MVIYKNAPSPSESLLGFPGIKIPLLGPILGAFVRKWLCPALCGCNWNLGGSRWNLGQRWDSHGTVMGRFLLLLIFPGHLGVTGQAGGSGSSASSSSSDSPGTQRLRSDPPQTLGTGSPGDVGDKLHHIPPQQVMETKSTEFHPKRAVETKSITSHPRAP